jgi:hypothetical protein
MLPHNNTRAVKLWKETAISVGSALTLQLGAVTQRGEQLAVEGIQSVQCSDHLYVSISVILVPQIKWCTRTI